MKYAFYSNLQTSIPKILPLVVTMRPSPWSHWTNQTVKSNRRNWIFGEKTAVDKRAWIKAWYMYLLWSHYHNNVRSFSKNYQKYIFLLCKYFAAISVASSVQVPYIYWVSPSIKCWHTSYIFFSWDKKPLKF